MAGEERKYLEEERSRIFTRVDELKQKVNELEQQLQETKHEVSSYIHIVPVSLKKTHLCFTGLPESTVLIPSTDGLTGRLLWKVLLTMVIFVIHCLVKQKVIHLFSSA